MGKSDRKIKSDAINALRKKYEAFLEQDRKRKERNEYILGILDKMRSCKAVVPHKFNPPGDCPVSTKNLVPTQDTLSSQGAIYPRRPHDPAMNTTSRITAENSIIAELLNKYILIPKRHCKYEESPFYDVKAVELQTNIQDNTDWKSKYEILNQLKQNEKEELEPQKDIPSVQSDINAISEELNTKAHINIPTRAHTQPPIEYGQDLPEKDTSGSRQEIKKKNVVVAPRKVQQSEQLIGNKQFYHTDTDLRYSHDLPLGKGSVTELIPKHSVPVKPLDEQNIDATNVDSGQLEFDQPVTEPNKTTTYEKNDKVEFFAANTTDPTVVPQSQVLEHVTPSGNYTDDVEYPVDVINVEQFTPNNDVILKDGVNVNPEGYGMDQSHFKQFSETVATPQARTEQQYSNETEQQQYSNEQEQHPYGIEQLQYSNEQHQYSNEQQIQYSTEQQQYENPEASNINQQIDETTVPFAEHVDDPSNPTVDEFEAEQTQFYQEPVEGDVTYDEQGANMYDTQNKNYQQNGQYYYEAPHEEAPSEINEHEETSQEYDPAYAQQYLNMQGGEYEQQQEIEQSDQQYTQQEGYEPAPVAYDQQYQEQPQGYEQYNQEYYDQQQYQQENYEAVQQIEQQLNNEENYSVVQNEVTDSEQQEVAEAVNQDQPEQAITSDVSTIRAN
ncbi:uncharacterized protein LOC126374920 [Pectinophora gossypiella]|uniref:uncharacterized protein LOC126374920 n=1 Tax=Pectinophora gossypiella TaxID=13191 RepID=UPI00214E4C35|nr:uncharacterized protein LOC126374920 [Pectinophora gossypiella]